MHIAVDISPLSTGHGVRGVGAYTKWLVEALQRYESKHLYSFFVRGQELPQKVDLVHYPYFDPYFLTLPLRKPLPAVVTVHDLTPLVFPEHFAAGIRGRLKWYIQRWSLKGITRAIADSENSKRDVLRFTKVPACRIDVVHLAPSEGFIRSRDTVLLSGMKKKHNLPARFILYVGDVNWNKNVIGLIEAFINIKYTNQKSKSEKLNLVLVGKAFENADFPEVRVIRSKIETAGLNREVRFLGYVPDEELPALYSLAATAVQPSYYEGFGLPVLEAMACGCPVVVARGSSLDEIAGPAIRVGHEPEAITEGITRALEMSQDERHRLIEAQFAWVQRFSWQKVARDTVASYEKALGGR